MPTLSAVSLHPIQLWHEGPPTSKAQRTEFASCMCHTNEWRNRHLGIAADRKGWKKNSSSCYFCKATAPQTSLKPAASLCTINLPPQGSQLHSDKESTGSFCHMLPISHLENTLKGKAYSSRSCGQSCWDPKKTVKAGSSSSYRAMWIHAIKALLEQRIHPHCGCCQR